jgi:hypothetical protein
LRRAMEPRRSIPFLLIFIVLIWIVFLGWFMFFRWDKENKDQTPQIVQTPIPQEYIDAYNEKQNWLLTSTGENINIQDEIKKQYEIDKLTSQLQMCENEIARLNYTTRENCAVCPITYEKDYNTCIEREKNNEWFIYQWKILEKICKANETSKEFCAKTYYDYFLLSQ